MNRGIEFGKCDICGKEGCLRRTYFEYDIKCDCHSPRHCELVVHCKDCIPSIPKEIHPHIKAMDGKSYKTTITNILPIEIVGEFIITEPIIQSSNMIHDEICTYEVCKLAKEKGFNEKCYHYYQSGVLESDECFNRYNKGVDSVCSAPTQSLLQRWLREEKRINISIDSDLDFNEENYIYEWQLSNKKDLGDGCYRINTESDMEFYPTYEEALTAALKHALENLV